MTTEGRAQYAHLYNGRRWREKRERQLSIEPLCRMCAQVGRVTAATVADHVVPHKGSLTLFWRGALQSLCKRCHDSHKQREERSGRAVGCDVHGRPFGIVSEMRQINGERQNVTRNVTSGFPTPGGGGGGMSGSQ